MGSLFQKHYTELILGKRLEARISQNILFVQWRTHARYNNDLMQNAVLDLLYFMSLDKKMRNDSQTPDRQTPSDSFQIKVTTELKKYYH